MLFTVVDLTSALEELGLAKFHSRAIGSLPSPTALTPEMVLAALIAAKMPYDQMSRVIPHMLQGRTGGSPRSDSVRLAPFFPRIFASALFYCICTIVL